MQQQHGVIAFASRHLRGAELKYTVSEKEALAILWASRHFKHYLYGNNALFMTDHKPLADMRSNREPEATLGRLMLKLQGDPESTLTRSLPCEVSVKINKFGRLVN